MHPDRQFPRRAHTRLSPRGIVLLSSSLLAAFVVLTGAGPRSGPAMREGLATYLIDNTNAACSNLGPGTPAQPYCTISAALAAHNEPGAHFLVLAGTYREQVLVPFSGAPAAPIVIEAATPLVTVDGTNDFSSPGLWAPVAGDVWLATTVTRAPRQVFADNARLTPASVPAADMLPGTFQFVPGTGLFVNTGPGNPAAHAIQVGARDYAFYLTARSWVSVRGFTVRRVDDRAIYFTTGSNDCEAIGNTTLENGRHGIQVRVSSRAVIRGNTSADNGDHGISITEGATGCVLEDNESMRNAHPTVRQANGIYLFGAPGNLLRNNRVHHNQDSGLQIQSGSNDNLSIHNRSWANGDHGFDNLLATGNIHIGCVTWGNTHDGFSVEGGATGTRIHNSIMAENGLTTGEYDLFVDPSSVAGFVADYNVISNSTPQPPVKFNGIIHPTLASYVAAIGQDVHSSADDPRFVNAAGGDFHLLAGSPAIDGADSGTPSWPAVDAEGRAPLDDPFTANTGAGPVAFADRGAFEFQPPPHPPVVDAPAFQTVVEKTTLTFRVTASDPDGDAIQSLTADLSGLPKHSSAKFKALPGNTVGIFTWKPKKRDQGTYRVTFLARNDLDGTATTTIEVTNPDRAPVVKAPRQVHARPGTVIAFQVFASDPDGDGIESLTADLSRLPAGGNAEFASNATRTQGTFTWTPTRKEEGNYRIAFIASNELSDRAVTHLHVNAHRTEPGSAEEPAAIEGAALDLPARIALSNGAPNPARGSVTFALELPRDEPVEWSIFDIQGRQVWAERRQLGAGWRTLMWDGGTTRGTPAGAGVYLARVRVGGEWFGRRIVKLSR